MRLTTVFTAGLGLASLVAAACSAAGDPAGRGSPSGAPGSGGSMVGAGGSTAVGGSGPSGGSGAVVQLSDGGTKPLDPDAACEGVSQQAEDRFQPADIVWAIDTSGSMIEEALAVQDNINAFSQQIVASGIDVHVVMLAGYQFLILPGICVPGPLGSGFCPPQNTDSNPPHFFHHPASFVDSVDAARILVQLFNDYRHMLRPGALKHLVVVTDDNSATAEGSTGNPGVYDNDPDRFINDFTALDPMLADPVTGAPAWKMSGIYAQSMCANAANVGTVWKEVIDRTGGVHGDICACPPGQPAPCQQTFQAVFNELATKIAQGAVPLDCEWGIPPAPQGQLFDPGLVNVEFADDDLGTKETIGSVPDPSSCDPVLGGWYYDDPVNPTRVIACPQSCDKIKSVAHGRVDIAFGCQTIVVPK